jgi:hypothetical protein
MLALQKAAIEYEASRPYSLDVVDDGRELKVMIRITKSLPDEISEKASSVIQNLRSALDNIAWVVSRRYKTTLKDDAIFFPIKKSRGKLQKTDSQRAIFDTGGIDWQVFINNVDPCPEGNELLCILNEMNNRDKHRELIAVGVAPVGMKVSARRGELLRVGQSTGFYQDGEVLARYAPGTDPKVSVNVQLTFKDVGRFKTDAVMDALHAMHTEVCKVEDAAERLFS